MTDKPITRIGLFSKEQLEEIGFDQRDPQLIAEDYGCTVSIVKAARTRAEKIQADLASNRRTLTVKEWLDETGGRFIVRG